MEPGENATGWGRSPRPAPERSSVVDVRRATYQGFGDALAMAFELVFTPLVFALGGWFLDRWLGTTPVLLIVLVVLAVVGMGVRMYYGYDARMKVHEAAGPWARRPVAETPAVPVRSAAPGSPVTPAAFDAPAPATDPQAPVDPGAPTAPGAPAAPEPDAG